MGSAKFRFWYKVYTSEMIYTTPNMNAIIKLDYDDDEQSEVREVSNITEVHEITSFTVDIFHSYSA